MTVRVKFVGSFRSLSHKEVLELKLGKPTQMKELVGIITEKIPRLALGLVDRQCEGPNPNMLALVNGKEISVLDRFETIIKDGDEIVFVPVVHGG